MNGAHSLVKTLLSSGIDTCFANPGTSEMHFVAALDKIPGIQCVLGLQENVVTGMADGYFRMARKPACTLLHCGPGLANGIANLHNAKRARSGIVNIVGDHATYHRPFDAPLTADTASLAASVSSWVRTSQRAEDVGTDAIAAVRHAAAYPGNIATLILPSDVSWNEGGVPQTANFTDAGADVDADTVAFTAELVRSGGKVLFFLSGNALLEDAQRLIGAIRAKYPVDVMAEYSIPRISRGGGRLPIEKIPYGIEAATQRLKPYDCIVLINANDPVAFFAYPGKPSRLAATRTRVHTLCRPEQDPVKALQALCDEVGAQVHDLPSSTPPVDIVHGAVSPEGFARNLAALMPEGAVVSDESISWGRDFYRHTYDARPHEWLHLTGGAIGDGLPVATGAAIATKGQRRVISLQADGSAMYSLQSLWTQAEQQLPCTTIILRNSKYNILIGEYKGVGAEPGATAMKMLDLGNPGLDWVKLAQGMGVEAASADSLERCADLMQHSFRTSGPFLIELAI